MCGSSGNQAGHGSGICCIVLRAQMWRTGVVPTRILIADDDVTIRLLLRRLLEQQPDWQVCGDASTGAEAIAKVEQLNPDVVVMDLSMPVMTGLQAAPAIARAHPRLPMLLSLIHISEPTRLLSISYAVF